MVKINNQPLWRLLPLGFLCIVLCLPTIVVFAATEDIEENTPEETGKSHDILPEREKSSEIPLKEEKKEPAALGGFDVRLLLVTGFVGERFSVSCTALDDNGKLLTDYTGENFMLSGGKTAPDGTEPLFRPRGEWEIGRIIYDVTLFAAGDLQKIIASDGKVRGESESILMKSSSPDEISISSGNGQSGPVGSDVTEVNGQDIEIVVYDKWKNPVKGVEVTFGNPSKGSIYDTDETSPGIQRVKYTDRDGKADCDVWVLGKKYGEYTIDSSMKRGTVKNVQFTAHTHWTTRKNLGVIFNIDIAGGPFLPTFEEYQGGIGAKYYITEKLAYKGLLSYQYINNSHSTSITLGNSVEYHIFDSRISPYTGGVLNLKYVKARTEVDALNWTEDKVTTFTLGPVFGLEFVACDFLSFFVEYELLLQFTSDKSRTSSGGMITKTGGDDFRIKSGLGNDAKIGMILYFTRIAKKW